MDMRNLLASDEHVAPNRTPPTSSVPQKRKRAPNDASTRSGETTPRPEDGAPSEARTPGSVAPLQSSTSVLKPPAFVASHEPGYFTTNDVPQSRNYRYLPAVLSPTYDPAVDDFPYYQTGESTPANCVRVSWEDRSPFIRVTEDGLGLAGDKGFRSARLNVPVREGQWYFEIDIIKGDGNGTSSTDSPMSGGAHVRLGWARRESSLNGPAGLDGYSYGYRDRSGEKVTLSRPKPYGKSYGTGDTIGLYISLPPRREANPNDKDDPARIVPKRAAIQYRGSSFFESSEYSHSKEMDTLVDNPDEFYKTLAEQSNATPENAGPVGRRGSRAAGAQVKNTPASAPSRKRVGGAPSPDQRSVVKKEPLRPLPTLDNSAISFFVNGEDQGLAFQDLFSYLQLQQPKVKAKGAAVKQNALKERENHFDDGTLGYYPFISLFGNAKVKINAGPDFKYAPPPSYTPNPTPAQEQMSEEDPTASEDSIPKWRPLCERYPEYLAELRKIDSEEENELRSATIANALNVKLAEAKEAKKKGAKAEATDEKQKQKTSTTPGKAAAKGKRSSASPAPGARSTSATPAPAATPVPEVTISETSMPTLPKTASSTSLAPPSPTDPTPSPTPPIPSTSGSATPSYTPAVPSPLSLPSSNTSASTSAPPAKKARLSSSPAPRTRTPDSDNPAYATSRASSHPLAYGAGHTIGYPHAHIPGSVPYTPYVSSPLSNPPQQPPASAFPAPAPHGTDPTSASGDPDSSSSSSPTASRPSRTGSMGGDPNSPHEYLNMTSPSPTSSYPSTPSYRPSPAGIPPYPGPYAKPAPYPGYSPAQPLSAGNNPYYLPPLSTAGGPGPSLSAIPSPISGRTPTLGMPSASPLSLNSLGGPIRSPTFPTSGPGLGGTGGVQPSSSTSPLSNPYPQSPNAGPSGAYYMYGQYYPPPPSPIHAAQFQAQAQAKAQMLAQQQHAQAPGPSAGLASVPNPYYAPAVQRKHSGSAAGMGPSTDAGREPGPPS